MSVKKHAHMESCYAVLKQFIFPQRELLRLSIQDLDPFVYANIAHQARDIVGKVGLSMANYELVKFADNLKSDDNTILVKKSPKGRMATFAIPLDRLEYAVALTVTYCYLSELYPSLSDEAYWLLGMARRCTDKDADKVVDYLVDNILGKAVRPSVDKDRLVAENQQLKEEVQSLRQQMQQVTVERDQLLLQVDQLTRQQQPQPDVLPSTPVADALPRGPFDDTPAGKNLDLDKFRRVVQSEFANVKSDGEWASLHYFCCQHRLIPATAKFTDFFDKLFRDVVPHDANGKPFAVPAFDPTYRYCNALDKYGVDEAWKKTSVDPDNGKVIKNTHMSQKCFMRIKQHYNNLKDSL